MGHYHRKDMDDIRYLLELVDGEMRQRAKVIVERNEAIREKDAAEQRAAELADEVNRLSELVYGLGDAELEAKRMIDILERHRTKPSSARGRERLK